MKILGETTLPLLLGKDYKLYVVRALFGLFARLAGYTRERSASNFFCLAAVHRTTNGRYLFSRKPVSPNQSSEGFHDPQSSSPMAEPPPPPSLSPAHTPTSTQQQTPAASVPDDMMACVAALEAALLPCLPARELQAVDRSLQSSHQSTSLLSPSPLRLPSLTRAAVSDRKSVV